METMQIENQQELPTKDLTPKINITFDKTKIMKEGKAEFYLSSIKTNEKGEKFQSDVFYNPVQVFNRDLTLLVLKTHAETLKSQNPDYKGLTILDALSASGLRPIRFLKELSNVNLVYANDISTTAHQLMKENFELNNLDMSKIRATKQDANKLMLDHRVPYFKKKGEEFVQFDVIDLDPYGSCIPFLDAAIQCANENTLICATFTDLRVLCGPDYSKCFCIYGSSRLRVPGFQENAIRIALYAINNIATRNDKTILPLLSYQSEFYLRVFFTLTSKKKEINKSSIKTGLTFFCDFCTAYHIVPFGREDKSRIKTSRLNLPQNTCEVCQEKFSIGGPIWIDNINNFDFVQKIYNYLKSPEYDMELSSLKKINGLLGGILNEKEVSNFPLSYNFNRMGRLFKFTLPKFDILKAGFESLNYKIVPSYIHEGLIKTNAPPQVVFDIFKSWKIKLFGEENYLAHVDEKSINYKALMKEIICKPDFDFPVLPSEKIKMFFPNPEPNWGPKKRATKNKKIEQDNDEHKEENEDVENVEQEEEEEEIKKEGDLSIKKIKI